MARFGCPSEIHTDQVGNFESEHDPAVKCLKK